MIDLVAGTLMVMGGALAVVAAVGLLRFKTAYARFHAAGKASPVAFLIAAVGAGLDLGPTASLQLAIAAAAMILTLPVGVHLLFRAAYRAHPPGHLAIDDLAVAENTAPQASRQPTDRSQPRRQ